MSYPYPAVFEGYEARRDVMRELAHRLYVKDFSLKPGTLLDAGCGEGFWGQFFHDWGFQVYGFDAEQLYIENGRRKYPQLDLIVARAEDDLPYDDDFFDLIFVRAISHFYAEDLTPATEMLANLHRYGGMLLISAYTRGDGGHYPAQFGDRVHTHHRPQALRRMVEQAGWKPNRIKQVGTYLQIGAR